MLVAPGRMIDTGSFLHIPDAESQPLYRMPAAHGIKASLCKASLCVSCASRGERE
jgi:hypothetical protein